ncbi:MAG: NAD(P)H-dependent oxidoreductase [Clostridia bacterium]|nr:NAD(P)H-dependent oxidoreductase [Clostridia bacterium]
MTSNLIIYYSRKGENYLGGEIKKLERGNTGKIVSYIKDALSADIFEIETVKEYPADYMACTEVAKAELKAGARPELKRYLESLDGYDNVFICGPCWWGTFPCAVFSQLERLSWKGKNVLPVMTHEGSGLGNVQKDLKKICKGASFKKALAVEGHSADSARDQVVSWAKSQI